MAIPINQSQNWKAMIIQAAARAAEGKKPVTGAASANQPDPVGGRFIPERARQAETYPDGLEIFRNWQNLLNGTKGKP